MVPRCPWCGSTDRYSRPIRFEPNIRCMNDFHLVPKDITEDMVYEQGHPKCPVCGRAAFETFNAPDNEVGGRFVDHVDCALKLQAEIERLRTFEQQVGMREGGAFVEDVWEDVESVYKRTEKANQEFYGGGDVPKP